MLAKEPDQRYQTIHEVQTNLSGLSDEIGSSQIDTGGSVTELPKGTDAQRGARVAELSRRRAMTWSVTGLLGAIAAFTLWNLWYEVPSESSTVSSSGESRPIVVMMDTPARPYDEEDRDQGLTNADVISGFLADLEVLDLRKESTNPQWNREDVIVSWNPDLIILHYSCFATETRQEAAYERLDTFLEYIAGSTKAHILMYSRSPQFWSNPD